MQLCGVCNTAVVLCLTPQLDQLHSFRSWLPRHAALIRSLTVKGSPAGWSDACQIKDAKRLLQRALQQTTAQQTGGPSTAAAPTATAAAVSDVQQQEQTQLAKACSSSSSSHSHSSSSHGSSRGSMACAWPASHQTSAMHLACWVHCQPTACCSWS